MSLHLLTNAISEEHVGVLGTLGKVGVTRFLGGAATTFGLPTSFLGLGLGLGVGERILNGLLQFLLAETVGIFAEELGHTFTKVTASGSCDRLSLRSHCCLSVGLVCCELVRVSFTRFYPGK